MKSVGRYFLVLIIIYSQRHVTLKILFVALQFSVKDLRFRLSGADSCNFRQWKMPEQWNRFLFNFLLFDFLCLDYLQTH
jgi:hypothetical protein